MFVVSEKHNPSLTLFEWAITIQTLVAEEMYYALIFPLKNNSQCVDEGILLSGQTEQYEYKNKMKYEKNA